MLNKEAKAIWLASYPKSGNTWVRLFYTALTGEEDININNIKTDGIISNRNVIDEGLGIYSSQIPQHDLLPYRTKLYGKWINTHKERETVFCKVHDACTLEGNVLFTPAITRGVVYVMRNPFDMAASLANHNGSTIDKALRLICSDQHHLAGRKTKLNTQISQYLGTWSYHVESWTNVHRNNILILKYEDLLHDSLNEFSKLANYLEFTYSAGEIESAIEKTSISVLQEQEKTVKFREKPHGDNFFRSGKTGGWRNELTTDQVNLIIDCNYSTLFNYGYIDAEGNVLV